MDQRGCESRKRVLVESLYLTSNCGDEKETFETTLVPVLIPIVVLISIVVLIFILGGVLVSTTERGSERERERGGGRRERDRRKTLSSNCCDERETFETTIASILVLIPIVVLISILGGVLISATEREREREREGERGERDRGKTLSEERVLVESLSSYLRP